MALDNVTKEIAASADKAVSEINAERDREVREILASAEAAIAELKAKEEKRLGEDVERLRRQELSSAELESRKVILSKKKEILARAFDSALSDLESAPEEERLAAYRQMAKSAKSAIGSPKALVSKKDGFSAKDLGVKSVEADPRIRSGIIFQSEDGTVEVDMQYETILREIWDSEIKAISDILFG
ncbi:MAG: hypothetical protein LBG62_06005 [Candidatus Methanoplasma sp.]|jgi:V/A-type H+-transporting ATPase subunit E|nr:hypothetical protein [Candidatus Methanoplasma sp.]